MPESESEEAAALRLNLAFGLPQGTVQRGSVRRWRLKGFHLDDIDRLESELWTMARVPEWLTERAIDKESELSPADVDHRFKVGRMLKVEAEAEIKGLEVQAHREKWVTAAEMHETGRQLGAILRSHLLQFPNQWAPILEGKTAAQMRVRMREEVARVLGDLERVMKEKRLPVDEE